MDVTNFLVAFLAISPVLDTVDGGVSSPPDMEVCEGENFTIPWSYDDLDSDISNVVWKVNTTNIMTYFGGGGNRTPEGGYNVISANNEGSITVTSAERSNTGTYRIDISALTSSSDEVDALVCKSASSTVDSTKTGSVIQCTASDLGEPEAQLYIKVNGNAQSSSSATVKNTDRVECCISGCAVKCIDGNNEYCKNIQGTTTTTISAITTTNSTNTNTSSTSTTSTIKLPSTDKNMIIGVCVGGGIIFVVIISIIICFCVRKNREKNKKKYSARNVNISAVKEKEAEEEENETHQNSASHF